MRREKSLCFNCDEKWIKGHRCKGKLLLLSVDGSRLTEINHSDSSDEEDVPETSRLSSEPNLISLNDMEGVIGPKTIRLAGTINERKVSVLVDSGSTHNFIQSEIVKKLKLPVSKIDNFCVTTGSMTQLKCSRVCKRAKIMIQETEIEVDLFLLPVTGANIILGIQWLQTLGRVITDYHDLYMEFIINGQVVKWTGQSWIDNNPLSNRELKSLTANQESGYMLHLQYTGSKIK